MGRAGEGRALSTAFLHGTGSSGQARGATPQGGTIQWQKLLQATERWMFGFVVGRNRHFPTFLARLKSGKGQIPVLGGEDIATPAAHPTRTHLEKKGLRPTRICSQLPGGHALGRAGLHELLSLLLCPLSIQTSSCQPSTRVWPIFLPPATLLPKICL